MSRKIYFYLGASILVLVGLGLGRSQFESTGWEIDLQNPSIVIGTGSDLPSKVKLKAPFVSQAPHKNWDDPYQEACEEAALLIVHHAFAGTEELSPDQADKELLEMIAWEEARGYGEDVTVAELAQIAADYYGYQTEIIDDPSVEDLEKLLAEGNPIIVPAAGRELGNPYFSGQGPWYHMLVIVGYDRKHFITHDVGTRRGKYYKYKKNVLMNAIHDWNQIKEAIGSGIPRVLIVSSSPPAS